MNLFKNGNIEISGRIQNESVIAPVLVNNWVNYGGAFTAIGYYKDKEGVVHLRGLIKDGSAALITTLPEGYRPSGTLIFTTNSNNAFTRLDVLSNGEVRLVAPYSNIFVSLSGISFRVD